MDRVTEIGLTGLFALYNVLVLVYRREPGNVYEVRVSMVTPCNTGNVIVKASHANGKVNVVNYAL